MQTLTKSIKINAPKEKVWDALVNHIKDWGSAFAEDVGGSLELDGISWFISKDGMGMKAKTTQRRENEYLQCDNFAIVENHIESSDMKEWAGSGDKYKLTEENGITTLDIESGNFPEEDIKFMEPMWDKALETIKNIAER